MFSLVSILAIASLALIAAPVPAAEDRFVDDLCGDSSSPLLILGTYHMANPGLDTYNVEADDVRSERRQVEIGELLDRLERFRPTVVAIESKYGRDTWPERYRQWLAGEYELGRDETEQIGFRLARRMKLDTVTPVDFPMWMNGWRNDEIDWDRLRRPEADNDDAGKEDDAEEEQADEKKLELTEEQRRLLESTIADYLAWLNSESQIREGHVAYMNMLLPHDGIGIYSKTDQVRNWYDRNLRIFTNLNRVTEHGNDRVLLIIGAGHLKILRDFAIDSPYFCLVDTAAYLQP